MLKAILLTPILMSTSPQEEQSPTVKRIQQEIRELRKSKTPSSSTGTLSNGKLRNAARLSVDGIGYRVASPKKKRNYGADELVFGLMELGARMFDRYGKGGVFLVGDISKKSGGKLKGHINHQKGLDVDLGFYLLDRNGKAQPNRKISVDENGVSKKGTLRFDVARNWDFIVGILESSHFGKIRSILLADWIKKLLLNHARKLLSNARDRTKRKRLAWLVNESARLIRQPKSSPHANHYHLSLNGSKVDQK